MNALVNYLAVLKAAMYQGNKMPDAPWYKWFGFILTIIAFALETAVNGGLLTFLPAGLTGLLLALSAMLQMISSSTLGFTPPKPSEFGSGPKLG